MKSVLLNCQAYKPEVKAPTTGSMTHAQPKTFLTGDKRMISFSLQQANLITTHRHGHSLNSGHKSVGVAVMMMVVSDGNSIQAASLQAG